MSPAELALATKVQGEFTSIDNMARQHITATVVRRNALQAIKDEDDALEVSLLGNGLLDVGTIITSDIVNLDAAMSAVFDASDLSATTTLQKIKDSATPIGPGGLV